MCIRDRSGIGVQIHSTDDRDQKSITGVNAALDEEAFEVGCVNEAEVAIVNDLITGVQVEVVARRQVLFEHLTLTCHGELLLDQLGEAPLDVVREEFIW